MFKGVDLSNKIVILGAAEQIPGISGHKRGLSPEIPEILHPSSLRYAETRAKLEDDDIHAIFLFVSLKCQCQSHIIIDA